MKLLNSFSLNMLASFPAQPLFEEISLDEAQALAPTFESAVGHADTAAVFGEQLGVPLAAVRATITLHKGDIAVIGQYVGPRLQEGSTSLPVGATIKWIRVTV